ncbi:hypothetical protein FPOA_08967 [Fusarium poae]|uniref:Heterokaryon incompatibility domain-containing protein n=1 Tax=Fusarium poae TaxID=36050 RepID=A0A1B8AQL9_FUSPO|nr:hypothetical protein FPOA_08967 [Fusarium poae]
MANISGYKQLEQGLSQIRLLHLLPQRTRHLQLSAPWYSCVGLECTFETVDLASAPPYEALSYTWGEEDASVRIHLNGKEFLVRPNLAYALAALRVSEPRVLWVDALCINQQDTTERNHQVGMMGGIFRRAERVLVWLGRPSSGWDSSVAGALRMAERLGDNPPISKLPPTPPQPNPHHEYEFAQWIKLFPKCIEERKDKEEKTEGPSESRMLHWETCFDPECPCWNEATETREKTSRELGIAKWQDRLDQQRRRWYQMRNEHALYKQKVKRLPAMIEDTQKDLPFLAQMAKELHELEVEEFQQQKLLSDLRLSESQQLPLLDPPQQRLLQDFQTIQIRAYQELSNANLGKFRDMDPEFWNRARPVVHVSDRDNQEQSETERLLCEILADLGYFQRSISDLRKQLQGEPASSLLGEKIDHIEKMQQLDIDHRRGLAKLQERLKAWKQPTDEQYGAGLKLLESQVEEFGRQVKDWETLQAVEIKRFGDLPSFISEQHESLQNFIERQCRDLERMKRGQALVSPALDAFLSEEEIQISKRLRSTKQEILNQYFVLRKTELRRRGFELVLQQCDRWRSHCDPWRLSMYKIKRHHNENRIREETVDAQLEWIQLWRDMVAWQSKEWHDLVFTQADTPLRLPDIDLLSLEGICRLPYWRRLWIVQEVLLAKELVLCFGDNARTTTSWDLFTKIRESLERIPNFWKFSPAVDASLKEISHAFPLRLDKLRNDDGESWSLHNLVDITRTSLCHDPRDKVYGLLGITSGFQFGDFDVRYQDAVEGVYRNAILWYHSKHGEDVSSPNLVRFSELLQLSLKNHQDTQSVHASTQTSNAAATPLTLDRNLLSGYTETFCMKGILGVPLLPIEKLMVDKGLMQTRRRDWISTLVEYFDDSGFRGPKTAIEEELLYLDSISTTLSLPNSSAYAVVEYMSGEPGPDICCSRDRPGQGQEPLFFLTVDGEFGISSTCIREGDLLCRFSGSNLGVVLRRGKDQYSLAGKAIMSSIETRRMTNKDESLRIVNLMLDISSILSLTTPLDIVNKHENREPLYIQESSFGWDEFIASGADETPNPLRQRQMVQTTDDPPEAEQEPELTSIPKFQVRTRVFSSEQSWLADGLSRLLSVAPMVSLDINETYPALQYPDPPTVSMTLYSSTPVNGPTTMENPYEEPYSSKLSILNPARSWRFRLQLKLGPLKETTVQSTPGAQGGEVRRTISRWWNRFVD